MTDSDPSDTPELEVVPSESVPTFEWSDDVPPEFEGYELRGAVPIEDLEDLIDRWDGRHDDSITMFEKPRMGLLLKNSAR